MQAFCILTPLLNRFFLKEWELDELIATRRESAHNFRKLHPTPNQMFPYWQVGTICRMFFHILRWCGTKGSRMPRR